MAKHWVHGVEVSIPDVWEDLSVHRFVAGEDLATASATSAATLAAMPRAKPPVALRANLVVTREALGEGPPTAAAMAFLERTAAEGRARNPSFQVQREGVMTLDGRAVPYLDASEVFQGLKVHQRYVAFVVGGGVTLFTLTGSEAQVETLSSAIGLFRESKP